MLPLFPSPSQVSVRLYFLSVSFSLFLLLYPPLSVSLFSPSLSLPRPLSLVCLSLFLSSSLSSCIPPQTLPCFVTLLHCPKTSPQTLWRCFHPPIFLAPTALFRSMSFCVCFVFCRPFFVAAQLVPFFFTTWEHYYTDELILPIVNGPSEGVRGGVILVPFLLWMFRNVPFLCRLFSTPLGSVLALISFAFDSTSSVITFILSRRVLFPLLCRCYQPALCRFISATVISFVGGVVALCSCRV